MLDDLTNAAADAKLALEIERRYKALAAGTLRSKRLAPEKMALILCRVADNLLDVADFSD